MRLTSVPPLLPIEKVPTTEMHALLFSSGFDIKSKTSFTPR